MTVPGLTHVAVDAARGLTLTLTPNPTPDPNPNPSPDPNPNQARGAAGVCELLALGSKRR